MVRSGHVKMIVCKTRVRSGMGWPRHGMACDTTTHTASTRTALSTSTLTRTKQLGLVACGKPEHCMKAARSRCYLLFPLLHSPRLEHFSFIDHLPMPNSHPLTKSQRLSCRRVHIAPQDSSSARPPSCTISHTAQNNTTMSRPTTTTTIPTILPISPSHSNTCPNAQPELVGTHALDNAVQVL